MKVNMQKLIRIPVSEKGVIVHKPKKGKGSYTRNGKHRRHVSIEV